MEKLLSSLKPLLFAFLMLSVWASSAQDMRFGKYNAADIAMTNCEFESDAGAVVLGEIGRSYFIGPLLHTSKHFRIKILDNNSSHKGDVVIRYYAGNDQQEMVTELKAQTMRIEGGKEVVTKLSKNDFFDVDAGNGYKEIRFTFPQVEAGSILEYEYKLISKNLTFLDGWVFPNDIPTLFSKYSIDIPEGLDYRMFGQGRHFAQANQNRKPNEAEWVLTNLKSMKPEPYMNNFIDHVDKVEFQLAGYVPGSGGGYSSQKGYQSVLNTWQKLADDLYAIDDFKSFFRNNAMAKSLQEIPLAGEDAQAKARSAYEFVQKNFNHNGKSGFVPTHSLKEVWESKSGSIAELNLLLIAVLNSQGIQAQPVLISTKGNGRAQLIDFPFALQFDELIVAAYLDDSPTFLNVYDKQLDFGYLPLDNMVAEGFLVNTSDSQIIPLHTNHKSGIQQMVNITINNNQISHAHQIRFMDYDAVDFKRKKNSQKDIDWYDFFHLDKDLKIFDMEEKDVAGKKKQIQTSFTLHRTMEENADLLLIQPLSFVRLSENPFKETERNFPVDFNFTFADNYTAILQIPENYELDDYPEDLTIALPDNLGAFMYKPVLANNSLRINLVWQLNRDIIEADHYPALKSFMEQVTNKIKEPIVLKAKL